MDVTVTEANTTTTKITTTANIVLTDSKTTTTALKQNSKNKIVPTAKTTIPVLTLFKIAENFFDFFEIVVFKVVPSVGLLPAHLFKENYSRVQDYT